MLGAFADNAHTPSAPRVPLSAITPKVTMSAFDKEYSWQQWETLYGPVGVTVYIEFPTSYCKPTLLPSAFPRQNVDEVSSSVSM